MRRGPTTPATEVTGATAFDTATVTGDGTQTPAGSVTYTFFDNGTCTTDANTTSDTEPVTGGLAQNSSTQGPLAAGSYSFQAVYNGDLGVGGDNDPSGPSDCEPFTVSQATPTAPTITNIPTNAIWSSGGGFTATIGSTDSDGTQSVTSSTPGVCTASGLAVTYVTAGTCTLTAQTAASTDYAAASGSPQAFTIGQATPSAPTITNIPTNAIWSSGGGFTATLGSTDSDGTQSVTSSTPGVCTASGLAVTYVTAGTCTLTAQTAASTDYAAASGSPQTFTIGQATPSGPTITNLPSDATWSPGGGFTATLGNTDSDGTQSVTSSTPDVCTAGGLVVTYVTAGTCTLTAQTAASTDYAAASGSPQAFTIGQVTPTAPTITNLPASPTWSGGRLHRSAQRQRQRRHPIGHFEHDRRLHRQRPRRHLRAAGTCTLTAQTAESTDYAQAIGSPQTFTIAKVVPAAPTITNVPSHTTWSSGAAHRSVERQRQRRLPGGHLEHARRLHRQQPRRHLRRRRHLHPDGADGGEHRLHRGLGQPADLHRRPGDPDRADDHERPVERDLELRGRLHRSAQRQRQRRPPVGHLEHAQRVHRQQPRRHLCRRRHLHPDGADGDEHRLHRSLGQPADLRHRQGDPDGADDLEFAEQRRLPGRVHGFGEHEWRRHEVRHDECPHGVHRRERRIDR